MPSISVILCTVREKAYADYPDWDAVGKVLYDLSVQTFKDFELIVVDGCFDTRDRAIYDQPWPFDLIVTPPRLDDYPWMRGAPAISMARNTGLELAHGQLIVNLDDACVLPPDYLDWFWEAWTGWDTCLVAAAPNDPRVPGRVTDRDGAPFPPVYGFNSFPLQAAIEINGYDISYDGGQGLEDADFSMRLHKHGVKHIVHKIPGFDILAQTAHARSLRIKKCCNRAWYLARSFDVQRANSDWREGYLKTLAGPDCPLLMPGGKCAHHHGRVACAYPDIARDGMGGEFASLLKHPPHYDLAKARMTAEAAFYKRGEPR
jgi:glycosyltransferase involved in cell wall biosynthesis